MVRARIEAAFGPDALDPGRPGPQAGGQAGAATRRGGKGPVAELMRRRRRRRADRHGAVPAPAGRPGNARFPGPAPRGHLPFTPRAKKSLALSLREATALHDDYIGVQHLVLAQLAIEATACRGRSCPRSASRAEALRAAVLARYRKAS